MKRITSMTTAALLGGLFAAGSAQAALIHAVGVDNQTTSTSSFITSWAALGVDGNATTETLTGVAGNVDGIEAFTYDITVTSVATGTPNNLSLQSAIDALGDGGDFDAAGGEGYDLTISNISNVNVQFDGFVQYSYSNTGNNEGAVINGTTYLRGTMSNLSPALVPVVTATTLEVRSIGTSTGRYADFQFSVVPEPGSLALLGLGGLLLGARRRRG